MGKVTSISTSKLTFSSRGAFFVDFDTSAGSRNDVKTARCKSHNVCCGGRQSFPCMLVSRTLFGTIPEHFRKLRGLAQARSWKDFLGLWAAVLMSIQKPFSRSSLIASAVAGGKNFLECLSVTRFSEQSRSTSGSSEDLPGHDFQRIFWN